MKYIILLLFSLNCFAEFKVDITNDEGQKMSKAGFKTIEKANNYISKVKRKWGRDKGWYDVACVAPIETREVEKDGEMVTEYHCHATFSYEIIDISEEMNAKKKEKEDRSKDIKAIKKMITNINEDPDLKPYLKKLLKFIVKEMRDNES